ncbi:MAG: magnesium-translocating P-type ATPase [Alphaproteobacteria bacterium]|nr:magnesium-translocating P-type ATPase [Alphaproteobacteria bacterium]MBV9693480.1 magnesium-translocating P-type ATPase [Alphaproteobacteria bacterium]
MAGGGDDFWSVPIAAVLARLGVDAQGLSSAAATQRLARYGPNKIADGARKSVWLEILKRFRNPLVIVLLLAAAIAGATGDIVSMALIDGIVLISVLLDFLQERRAEAAAEALRDQVALMASALRDGKQQAVRAADLVPGDVIELRAGDLVPADCRLLAATDLFVNQSLLTGESFPAAKSADVGDTAGQDTVPENAAFMGSSVVSGTARALLVRTGSATMLGGIAGSLHSEPPPTAFALGLRDFSLMIVRLTVLLVLFVLLVNLMLHRPPLESFLFAVALAVGLTPELLPMIVSVTLAYGALRMAGKHVIVKRLSAIHDLGSMDVLCSDKTGTLTKAAIDLVQCVDLEGLDSAKVRDAAYLNAHFQTGIKSPLDDAIVKNPCDAAEGWIKRDEKPFDFERRRTSVLIEKGAQRSIVVKGAPEDILKLSTGYARGEETVPLGEAERAKALAMLQRFGEQGLRALGVAWRDGCVTLDESALVFGGFALFLDPPKETAAGAIEALAGLGIAVKVITGDNEHVTNHVCQAIALPDGDTLTGDVIDKLSDEALAAKLRSVNKFCRVTPAQKLRIISALRRARHVVGYIGDGINDAPSLHAADVSLSVDGAVDVAKEAASMILLKNDLGVIVDGVREGRRTFANILKYVMMATSSNFGNMFSMAGGVLFLPFLPMLPVQILLNNLLYDISEIAIPMDEVDEEMILRPRRWDIGFVRRFMFVLGPVSSLFDFVTFGLLLFVFHAGQALFHTGWFVESLATQCLVIFVIRSRGRPWRSTPSRWLAAGSLGAVAVACILPYTIFGRWLGFVAMPASLLLALAATTATYLLLVEFVKGWFFRRYPLAVNAP